MGPGIVTLPAGRLAPPPRRALWRRLRELCLLAQVPEALLAQEPEAQRRELSQLPRHRAVREFESRIRPIAAGLPCEFGWGMISGYQGCERGNQPGLSGSRGSREGRRRSGLTTWELIAEKAKVLPPEKQQEVLDFLEFLARAAAAEGPAPQPPRALEGPWPWHLGRGN